MNEREVLIWDWDDVLADGRGLQAMAARRALGPGPWQEVAEECALPGEWEDILGHLGLASQRMVEQEMKLLLSQFLPSRPGAGTVVGELAQRWRMALVGSSSEEILDIYLRRAGLRDLFEIVVGGDRLERGKPDSEIYLRALDGLGVAEEAAWVLAGSEIAARAAGDMDYLLLARDDIPLTSPAAQGASRIFWRLTDLPRFL